MIVNMPLVGMRVLITRPFRQSKHLVKMITQEGGKAIYFPVMEIRRIERNLRANISLVDADIIIFVSRNAVDLFFSDSDCRLPISAFIIAIGKGTAAILQQYGVSNVLHPSQGAGGSEGVLMLPELEQVTDKRIIIIRGRGGRELLADTLAARGAKIIHIEVYERILPVPTVEQYMQAPTARILVCTSVTGVINLSWLLRNNIEIMLVKPLIVLSKRIKQHALSLGFKEVVVSVSADDRAIMQLLLEMKRSNSR